MTTGKKTIFCRLCGKDTDHMDLSLPSVGERWKCCSCGEYNTVRANSVKQIMVVRKDLNMRKGKIAAQAAHSSSNVFFDRMAKVKNPGIGNNPKPDIAGNQLYVMEVSPEMALWLEGDRAKICVSAQNEEELLLVYEKAKEAGLPCALITDLGKTEFHGVPTNTAVSIGPGDAEKIDRITGHLPLL